jgi:hypothetical protein
VIESAGRESIGHAARAGIAPDRSRNVAIRVRIAMQDPAERRSDHREVGKLRRSHDGILGPVEIERQQTSARLQHARDLNNRGIEIRNVPKSIPSRDQFEGCGSTRQAGHVSGDTRGRVGFLPSQLQHPMRDIERDRPGAPRRHRERNIARSGGKIERPFACANPGKPLSRCCSRNRSSSASFSRMASSFAGRDSK